MKKYDVQKPPKVRRKFEEASVDELNFVEKARARKSSFFLKLSSVTPHEPLRSSLCTLGRPGVRLSHQITTHAALT